MSEESKTLVTYKGPSMHERVITRKDLESADVTFPEGTTVKDMVWKADEGRRAVDISDLGDDVKEFFSNDKLFEVKEGGEVTSAADKKAGETNADGTNKAETTGDGVDHTGAPGSSGMKVGGSTRTR